MFEDAGPQLRAEQGETERGAWLFTRRHDRHSNSGNAGNEFAHVYCVTAAAGVGDQLTNLVLGEVAIGRVAPEVGAEDVVLLVLVEECEHRDRAGAYAEGYEAADRSRQRRHDAFAVAAVETDGVVVEAGHQVRRVAGAAPEPGQRDLE